MPPPPTIAHPMHRFFTRSCDVSRTAFDFAGLSIPLGVLLLHDSTRDWVSNTKVADFGTVREDVREKVDSDLGTDVTGNQKSHGVTGHIIGTRAYMPSEYTLGHVGPKTDAFAFGVVLIELLSSRWVCGCMWVSWGV